MKALKGIIAIVVLIAAVVTVICLVSPKYSKIESFAQQMAETVEKGDVNAYYKLTGQESEFQSALTIDSTLYLYECCFGYSPFSDYEKSYVKVSEVKLLGVTDSKEENENLFGQTISASYVTAVYEVTFEYSDDYVSVSAETGTSTDTEEVTNEKSITVEHTWAVYEKDGQYYLGY